MHLGLLGIQLFVGSFLRVCSIQLFGCQNLQDFYLQIIRFYLGEPENLSFPVRIKVLGSCVSTGSFPSKMT
ncbi:MAG: hypothetical protein A2007_02540 [Verrucomicrobia bacterium GWC2_42_7]|nr:MAG: hypothetical protein A2007_02540 [Verrucomicrobia bacterium GWC2_42_7]